MTVETELEQEWFTLFNAFGWNEDMLVSEPSSLIV
jgi:tRNA pseudouridine65 synthase